MALSTTSSNGLSSQANTQAPQSSAGAGAGSPAAAPAGDVQPGTTNSLLTSSNGITLGNNALSTVQLGGTGAGQTSAQVQQAAQPAHHVSPAFLGFSAGLFVLAVVVFWLINRSAKNTTE